MTIEKRNFKIYVPCIAACTDWSDTAQMSDHSQRYCGEEQIIILCQDLCPLYCRVQQTGILYSVHSLVRYSSNVWSQPKILWWGTDYHSLHVIVQHFEHQVLRIWKVEIRHQRHKKSKFMYTPSSSGTKTIVLFSRIMHQSYATHCTIPPPPTHTHIHIQEIATGAAPIKAVLIGLIQKMATQEIATRAAPIKAVLTGLIQKMAILKPVHHHIQIFRIFWTYWLRYCKVIEDQKPKL